MANWYKLKGFGQSKNGHASQPCAARDLAYWGPKSVLGSAVELLVDRPGGHSAGQARERDVGWRVARSWAGRKEIPSGMGERKR